MNTLADKAQENKSQSLATRNSQKQSGGESIFQFVDNRPVAIAQRKLQEMANDCPGTMQLKAFDKMMNPTVSSRKSQNSGDFSNQNAPIQRVVFVKGPEGTRKVDDDDYELADGEEYDDEALEEYYEQEEERKMQEREAAKLGARQEREAAELAAQQEREAAELAARREEVERQRLLAEREGRLRLIPMSVSRSDRNFPSPVNSRGNGKAHLLDSGLAPAGPTSISHAEQLDQESQNKGTSNLISFTGPNPKDGGQEYGGGNAQKLTVKTRKIARAKEKGKPDAQHLEISTSSSLLADPEVRYDKRLRSYVKKDDEHQIRVNTPVEERAQTIPRRFIYGAGLANEHDSDSDEDH